MVLDRVVDQLAAGRHRSDDETSVVDPRRGPEPLRLTLIDSFAATRGTKAIAIPVAAQRVLALLAVHGGPLHRAYVASMLWLDSSEAHAGGSLRSTLWRLGRSGVCFVETSDNLLRLSPDVTVDLCEAEAQARRLLSGDLPAQSRDLDCGLLSRDLLSGWYDDWVLIERERFRQLRLHALEAICERLVSLKRFGEAVEAGFAAVAGEPLRESAHRALIHAYLAEGNPIEAVRQFRAYAQMLKEELGAEISPLMRELVRGLPVA